MKAGFKLKPELGPTQAWLKQGKKKKNSGATAAATPQIEWQW